MENLKCFTANAWGWLFLCGFVVGVLNFVCSLVLIGYIRYKNRKELVKKEAEQLARLMAVSEKLRRG